MFEPPPPPPPFRAVIIVDGDPGERLEGATVVRAGKPIATTDAAGRAELVVDGIAEGEAIEATVTCPVDRQQPVRPISMRVTRLVGERLPEFGVACPKTKRSVVVTVRAENGPSLPVMYLGQVVATTDPTGAASFVVDAEPGTFNVQLDTSSRKDIKPVNPSRAFTVGLRDDLVLFDQKFDVEKKKVFVRKVARPRCMTCGRGDG